MPVWHKVSDIRKFAMKTTLLLLLVNASPSTFAESLHLRCKDPSFFKRLQDVKLYEGGDFCLFCSLVWSNAQ